VTAGALRSIGFAGCVLMAANQSTTQNPPPRREPSVTRAPFGTMPDGTPVELFTLTNRNGLEVRVITYGAIIQAIRVPDRNGRFADVVNGHDSLEGYRTRSRFFGAVVGRYGNRIAGGKFTLDNRDYSLAVNNGPNHLHGGVIGFDKVVWTAASVAREKIELTRISPDGEEGYPGTVHVTVTYALSDANELSVRYHATTDKPTPINLTQHSYFNLAGHDAGDIGGHVLMLNADRYTPVDATQIPTGAVVPVAGTPFDFRRPTAIGARIDGDDDQLKLGGGYDHNFVLNGGMRDGVPAAEVVEPRSGRTLQVSTTEPGIQFYSGNKLDGSITGKGGTVYGRRSGFCLETQHFPDSPHHANFPSTILRPGQTFESMTVFKFGVRSTSEK
jgi:aldose 1-epimerase